MRGLWRCSCRWTGARGCIYKGRGGGANDGGDEVELRRGKQKEGLNKLTAEGKEKVEGRGRLFDQGYHGPCV